MGQIVGGAAKPKRCNVNQLSQVPTPAAGEYILVSSDNSMNAAGQGNFDCYIVGDRTTAATALELHNIDPVTSEEVNTIANKVDGMAEIMGFTQGTENLFSPTMQKAGILVSAGKVTVFATAQSYLFKVNPSSTITVDHKTTGNRFSIWSFTSTPQIGDTATQTISNNSANTLAITLGASEHYILVYVNTGGDVDVSGLRVYYGTTFISTPSTSLADKKAVNNLMFKNGCVIETSLIEDYSVDFKNGQTWRFKNLLSSAYQIALYKTEDKNTDGRLLISMRAGGTTDVTLTDDYVILSTYSAASKKFSIIQNEIILGLESAIEMNSAEITTEKFRRGWLFDTATIEDYPVVFKSGEKWHFTNLLPSAYQIALFKTSDKATSGRLLISLTANGEAEITLTDNYVLLSTYSAASKKFSIALAEDDSAQDDNPEWERENIPTVPYKVFDSLVDQTEQGYVAMNGGISTDERYIHSNYIAVKPSHKYRLTIDGFICAYDSAKQVIQNGGYQGTGALIDYDYTTPSNCAYVIVSARCAGTYISNAGYFKFYDLEPTYLIPSEFLHWKPMNGKKIVVFGDSIVGNIRAGWPLMLQEKTGALVYNCGFGGCRMELLNGQDVAGTNPFSMCSLVDSIISEDWSAQEASPLYENNTIRASLSLLKTIDFSEVDIVLIAYGTNELGYPQDDEQNPTSKYTYAGATRYSLDTLMAQFKQLGIMLLTPIYRYSFGTQTTEDSDTYTHPTYGGKLTDNVATLKEVAQEYKVPCIDMYYQLGINKINRDLYYIDGTHLNYVGLQRYSGFVAQSVEKYQ